MVDLAPSDNGYAYDFSDDAFNFLAKLAYDRTGIVLTQAKKNMVYSRLVRRVRTLGLSGFSEYCRLMQGSEYEDEIGHLVNAITTNLTKFFREEHHFDHLSKEVLTPLVMTPPNQKRLRLWSAGCSSGMEAYSMAMTVDRVLGNKKDWDIKILATDIDTNMLSIGTAGLYPDEQYENIPSQYRHNVMKQNEQESIQMADNLKSLVSFKPLNLLGSWPMSGLFDVVFCRNVVIYFDKPTQKTLFSRIADHIQPHGWLYIGHSETLSNISDRFELISRTIYRKLS